MHPDFLNKFPHQMVYKCLSYKTELLGVGSFWVKIEIERNKVEQRQIVIILIISVLSSGFNYAQLQN